MEKLEIKFTEDIKLRQKVKFYFWIWFWKECSVLNKISLLEWSSIKYLYLI